MSDRRGWSSARTLTIAAAILLAAGCWAFSAMRMRGMDGGPGSDLGTASWFMATWIAMMAAMMLPVVAPRAARLRAPRPSEAAPALQRAAFLVTYLAVWALAGLLVYAVIAAGRDLFGDVFAWTRGGRWTATAALAAAAGYQLTRRKRRALERCKQESRLDGRSWQAGLRAGLDCFSSSWAMMAALFALGAMSLWWMAVVAALIAAERLPRPSIPGRLASAAVFLSLALGMAISPAAVPGFTVPGSPTARRVMMQMPNDGGSMR